MYLKRLKLKNYRLFSDVEIIFQYGMNVLIGKNSTGKSTVLEAVDFLLSSNNANIPAEEIIPYNKRYDRNVQVRVEGSFEMSNIEKDNICSILNNEKECEQIRKSQLEITFAKIIRKTYNHYVLSMNYGSLHRIIRLFLINTCATCFIIPSR